MIRRRWWWLAKEITCQVINYPCYRRRALLRQTSRMHRKIGI